RRRQWREWSTAASRAIGLSVWSLTSTSPNAIGRARTSTHRRGRTRRCGRGSRTRRRPRRGAQSRRCRRASPARRRRSRRWRELLPGPLRARKVAGRCARRQRTGAARRGKRYGRLRGDGNAARFGPLALRQRHLEHAVHEARRDLVAVEVLGVSEREAAQIVADVVLGVDWRQTLVLLR